MTENPAPPPPPLQRGGTRLGLVFAGAVGVYGLLAYLVLRPLHAQGVWQPLLGYLLAFDRVLQTPGLALERLFIRQPHHLASMVWAVVLLGNMVLYFLIGSALSRRLKSRSTKVANGGAESLPPGYSRRRFLGAGLRALGGAAVATFGYSLLVEPRWFGVSRRVVSVHGLPEQLNGLRVVQLTDIHHGPWLSLEYVREVVETANNLEPDLICLTGDYVQQSPAYVVPVVAELACLRARIGVVGVLGNHDWWEDARLTQREFDRAGIPLLDNTRRVLTPDRQLAHSGEHGLAICGVGDLWEDVQDYEGALGGLPSSMPRLLLSHNPDAAEDRRLVRSGLRVDLMLSGHTHGGQLRFPGIGSPVTNSRFGQKYRQGMVAGPICPVFVCRGIGVSGVPLRFGVPPEIAVLELRCAESATHSSGERA